jgi:hypothetical protein
MAARVTVTTLSRGVEEVVERYETVACRSERVDCPTGPRSEVTCGNCLRVLRRCSPTITIYGNDVTSDMPAELRHMPIAPTPTTAPEAKMSIARRIVINACYGGFSLSPMAVRKWAEADGRECYFFRHEYGDGERYVPITEEEASKGLFWCAFDVPDPNALFPQKDWREQTKEERESHSASYDKHALFGREIARDDPRLIDLIEMYGSDAVSGSCASLKIVEVPDGVDWEIQEYDGNEWVAEKHETWS